MAQNRWALPAELELQPGAEYYLRVDAFLEEARRLSSRHVRFTIPEAEGAAR